MKRVLWLLAWLAVVLLSAAPVQADESFYVAAVRPFTGTRITSLPFTITASGNYHLVRNLSSAGGNGITINADNVTLDLMGFCLTGSPAYAGISIGLNNNVEVRNGTITGWGAGISGAGSKHRIIGIRAIGNSSGIYLNGNYHLIKGCMASQGSFGAGSGLSITGTGIVSNCTVMGFTYDSGHGIYIGSGTVSDNLVINCIGASMLGIIANQHATISRNSVINCTHGISAVGGGSIIGNAVFGDNYASDISGASSSVADQNSFSGEGGRVNAFSSVWGVNGFIGFIIN